MRGGSYPHCAGLRLQICTNGAQKGPVVFEFDETLINPWDDCEIEPSLSLRFAGVFVRANDRSVDRIH